MRADGCKNRDPPRLSCGISGSGAAIFPATRRAGTRILEISARNDLCRRGTARAVALGAVLVLLRKLSATFVILTVLGLQADAFAAACGPQRGCATGRHACCAEQRLTRCCCQGESDGTDQTAPVPARTQISADFTVTMAPPAAAFSVVSAGLRRFVGFDQSPPHRASVDLFTFFASFLN
jgi:hypothetical protein